MQHIISESARKKAAQVVTETSLARQSVPVGCEQEVVGVVAVRGTRASTVRESAENAEHDRASAQSDCQPLDLVNVIDLPESYVEDMPAITPVESLVTLLEGEELSVPLPMLVGMEKRS